MRMFSRISGVLILLFFLSGCGFQLRGSYRLPYESFYIATPEFSVIGANLKRTIQATGSTRLAEKEKDAEGIFRPVQELRLPIILSLSSTGRVREKRLIYRYAFQITSPDGKLLVPSTTVEVSRDVTYADSDVLAKTQEEELLWRDMERDLVQQIVRRIEATSPHSPTVE